MLYLKFGEEVRILEKNHMDFVYFSLLLLLLPKIYGRWNEQSEVGRSID